MEEQIEIYMNTTVQDEHIIIPVCFNHHQKQASLNEFFFIKCHTLINEGKPPLVTSCVVGTTVAQIEDLYMYQTTR